MKYILGSLLLALGIAALVLCLMLRSQFQAIAVAAQPNLDSYPLLKLVIPEPKPGMPSPKPADMARGISFRIYAIGGIGVLLIVSGLVACIGLGSKRTAPVEA